MELRGEQIKQLQEALQRAFPDKPRLKQLVREELEPLILCCKYLFSRQL